jgi:hypothetical protein
MIYGSETWPVKIEDTQKLERMMVRHMCGVTLKDRKSAQVLRERLGIDSVTDIIRTGRLRWFGHVERKEDNDWVKACQRLEITGKRGKGRGKKTWRECVEQDMKVLGVRQQDAQDHVVWRGVTWGGPSDLCKHGLNRR